LLKNTGDWTPIELFSTNIVAIELRIQQPTSAAEERRLAAQTVSVFVANHDEDASWQIERRLHRRTGKKVEKARTESATNICASDLRSQEKGLLRGFPLISRSAGISNSLRRRGRLFRIKFQMQKS